MAECKVTLHGAKRHGDGVHCELSVHPAPKEGTSIKYIASAPAERRSSFTGSCLPFANERQAFANTPNVGEVRGSPQPASIHLPGAPNSYYAGLGTLLIPPHVRVEYLDQSGNLRRGSASLANVVGVPFRTNTYQRMRTGAEFYDVPDVLARSQPQILQASAFPASAATAAAVAADLGDFWRGKPPSATNEMAGLGSCMYVATGEYQCKAPAPAPAKAVEQFYSGPIGSDLKVAGPKSMPGLESFFADSLPVPGMPPPPQKLRPGP